MANRRPQNESSTPPAAPPPESNSLRTGADVQRNLSEYLQCELYHVVGSYSVATERLDRLLPEPQSAIEVKASESQPSSTLRRKHWLANIVEQARDYNRELDRCLHASPPREDRESKDRGHRWLVRHTMPDALPLSHGDRFKPGPRSAGIERLRNKPWRSEEAWLIVPRFYDALVSTLNQLRVPGDYDRNLIAHDNGLLREHGRSGSQDDAAIGQRRGDSHSSAQCKDAAARLLARSITTPRDGTVESHQHHRKERREGRLLRYRDRRKISSRYLSPRRWDCATDPADDLSGEEQRFRDDGGAVGMKIVTGDLGACHDSFPRDVINAQAEAHFIMHAVEAWWHMPLGERAEALGEDERRWLKCELDRSIALSTFAFSASRIAPWIFAADPSERVRVSTDFAGAWENMLPARCIWIANQVCLLALHRRGYAHMLNDEPAEAYNDFHKLHRLIRDAERRVEKAPTHVAGAPEFLTALDAQAHHHIGELYRVAHAHGPALLHFEAASHRIEIQENNSKRERPLKKDTDENIATVLESSRWHVELEISRGKAAYELGHHKEALIWHLRAWRRFLRLLAQDADDMEANTAEIDRAIAWLERIKFEPELRKSEIIDELRPVVDQLKRITVSHKLAALGAEVLLRLGHLLFELNVGLGSRQEAKDIIARIDEFKRETNDGNPEREYDIEKLVRSHIKGTLAFDCLAKALACDRHSTLLGADILMAELRFTHFFGTGAPEEYKHYLEKHEDTTTIGQHWPHGGTDYERLTRAAEYLTFAEREERFERGADPPGADPNDIDDVAHQKDVDRLLARDLLVDFLMNTMSTNVRKSQVHGHLMRDPRRYDLPKCDSAKTDGAKIEFISMRRYSSAFPLLPRPSAFRSLGGGYFVRLRRAPTDGVDSGRVGTAANESNVAQGKVASKTEHDCFGIVVDPGFDFVENLYRTGYSIADIDMIVVTHDHVDHLGAFDQLRSLLFERGKLGEDENTDKHGEDENTDKHDTEPKPVAIHLLLGKSVYQRYVGVIAREEKEEKERKKRRDEKPGEEHREPSIKMCWNNIDCCVGDNNKLKTPNNLFPGYEFWFPSSKIDTEKGHEDLGGTPSRGICIRAVDDGPSLAITSDVPAPPPVPSVRYDKWRKVWNIALNADVLVAHLSSVPLTELRRMEQPTNKTTRQEITQDAHELSQIRKHLEKADNLLAGEMEYGQWLRSAGGRETADIVGMVPDDWQSPYGHPYLEGTLRWAREYAKVREKTDKQPTDDNSSAVAKYSRGGLFIVGELSEELGTMRGKVARRLNDFVFGASARAWTLRQRGDRKTAARFASYRKWREEPRPSALTADIGLRVCIQQSRGEPVKVLCTSCDLDNDRAVGERYHTPREMHEVCVKGENEGIFYNCPEHDPGTQADATFLEKLERFDVYGR